MTNPLAEDLGGVVRLLERDDIGKVFRVGNYGVGFFARSLDEECPCDLADTHDPLHAETIVACMNFVLAHSAEIAGALRDAERWQTIESAPRDGERIILGRPDLDGDGGGISVAGYWLEELEDGVDYMGHDGGFTDVDFQVFQPGRSFGADSYRYAGSQPTHWRPLPAPPTEDSAMQQGGGGE